jgi:restriction system protein
MTEGSRAVEPEAARARSVNARRERPPPGSAAPEATMDIDETPLLHEPDLMLAVLRVAAGRAGTLDACIDQLRTLRDCARVRHRVPEAAVRARLATVTAKLDRAGLIELSAGRPFRITPRGRKLLADHPGGIDDSVLMQVDEARVPSGDESAGPDAPVRSQADAGYDAYGDGLTLADNPHPFDTRAHLDWQNGWSQARDEALRRRG